MTIWTLVGGALSLGLLVLGVVLVIRFGVAQAERARLKREASERQTFIENEIRKSRR